MQSIKRGVSVLIRTRDMESRFSELLQRLSHQTVQPLELIVVDNFSSKESLEKMKNFLRSAKAKFFKNLVSIKLAPIADEEFSHPFSTNVGVFIASCDFVCITNGHSLPLSNSWLENGLTHFENPNVAGVGGYFSPHEDGGIWEKIVYGCWSGLNGFGGARSRGNHFSTVNCIIRKSLWKEYPFDEKIPCIIPYSKSFGGEDYDWAVEMKARGYKVVLDPKFNVHHSHGEKLHKLVLKHVIWSRIKAEIRSLKRPRVSYTRLVGLNPEYYTI
ncbi:MAG: glycosyltransferase family A protein [Candidatus Bathyarchaeia archaeon]